ncbi:MAG: NADH-quinone oxidoreductase subunit M [Dehalococcoidia bacterium]|nr:NADH-quinone oxidoreductase subunit M [Dehalococcoidia bacterium]
MLSAIVFLPLAGAMIILLLLKDARQIRLWAAAVTVVELALALAAFVIFRTEDYRRVGDMEMVEVYRDWIPALNIQYHLGVDGLSTPLVLLTALLGMCAVFASWQVQLRVKEYFMWLLVLQTAVTGVFVSLDFVLFFIFWELELLPMYFLISIWGSGRKEYSAMKFLIFTLLGSAFMLVGILALYFSEGTFNIVDLQNVDGGQFILPAGTIFALLFGAFAVKLPVWPVHTWLPDAHTDAPTAVSVMLAGVLLKMGGYGMIRMAVGIFPGKAQEYAWVLAFLAVVSVLYGAVVTVRQTDLKRLVAFSSISHMGYVLLGISSVVGVGGAVSSVGLTGAAMQMFTHGTITGLLFLLVGLVYDKAHTRHIPDMGGLAAHMPIIAVAFLVAGLASLGLPGTSGFVSELLVFLGTFQVWSWITALAVFAIVITAGYILWMIQRAFFGPSLQRFASLGDATVVEAVPMAVLVITIMVVGVYPAVVSDVFTQGLEPIIQSLQQVVRP